MSPSMASDAWLEQLAFDAANHNDVPDWAQDTVRKLWREYCRLEKERDEARSAMTLMFSAEEVQKIVAKIPEARNKALDEAVERLRTTARQYDDDHFSGSLDEREIAQARGWTLRKAADDLLALKSKEPT